jgi:hypothetical protein
MKNSSGQQRCFKKNHPTPQHILLQLAEIEMEKKSNILQLWLAGWAFYEW